MTTKKRPSLLERQLSLLTGGDTSHPATLAEGRRIESLRLPALTLPTRLPARRRAWPVYAGLMAVAAATLLVLWARMPRRSDDDLRIKGAPQVWIYWERGGEVKTFEPGDVLASGDRVRAEILAPEPVVAYWGVTDGEGRLLSAPSDVWASALRLGPGERGVFAGSVKLVGASEGETLVVITCRGQDLPRAQLELASLPSACGLVSFKLR